MYPVVLFSGRVSTRQQAQHLLEEAGFEIGSRHEGRGLADWPEDADALALDEPEHWTPIAESRRGTKVAWIECVNVPEPDEADEYPWAELLYGDRSEAPGGLEALGWQLRMHEVEGVRTAPLQDDALAYLDQRISALETLLSPTEGHPDPGAIQAAAQSPPYAIQASSHGAELFRRATNMMTIPSRGGTRQAADLLVTQNGTPNMSTNIAAGEILIPGTTTGAQGIYYGYNDATVNLAYSASNPSNPRIDVPCATVDDAAYAGGANDWKLQVITGTPAGSPAVPSLPASSISLANVAVAANATTIVTANITVPVIRAGDLTGFTPVLSTAQPSSPWNGMGILETDTTYAKVYDSTPAAFVPLGQWGRSWTFIQEVNLGADGAISLTSIPQTFTHLQLVGVLRASRAAVISLVGLRFNNDTAANYDFERMEANGAGAMSGAVGTAVTAGAFGNAHGNTAAANLYAPFTVTIPCYRQANVTRMFNGDITSLEAGVFTLKNNAGGKWRSTAAITQIDLYDSDGSSTSFKAGSRVTLLGMR